MSKHESNKWSKAGYYTGIVFRVVPMTFICIGWWYNFIRSLIITLGGM